MVVGEEVLLALSSQGREEQSPPWGEKEWSHRISRRERRFLIVPHKPQLP